MSDLRQVYSLFVRRGMPGGYWKNYRSNYFDTDLSKLQLCKVQFVPTDFVLTLPVDDTQAPTLRD